MHRPEWLQGKTQSVSISFYTSQVFDAIRMNLDPIRTSGLGWFSIRFLWKNRNYWDQVCRLQLVSTPTRTSVRYDCIPSPLLRQARSTKWSLPGKGHGPAQYGRRDCLFLFGPAGIDRLLRGSMQKSIYFARWLYKYVHVAAFQEQEKVYRYDLESRCQTVALPEISPPASSKCDFAYPCHPTTHLSRGHVASLIEKM